MQPQIFNVIAKNHFPIWSSVLIYEYICGTNGLGNLLRFVLKYNDLSAMITALLLLLATFVIMDYLMNQIKIKFFFWEYLDE